MTCKGCHSNKQGIFNSEVAVHFAGREGLDKSLVFVFPRLVVCFDCAFTEFSVPKRELQVLERGSPVDGVAVLKQRVERVPEKEIKSNLPGMDG